MDERPSSRVGIILLAIGTLALGLRLFGIAYGLPAVYNEDEVAIMNRALAFGNGDLNPHNFVYPTFYLYALFAWEGAFFVAGRAAGLYHSIGEFQREFFIDPTRLYLAGRVLTALCGTATVIATYRLGARLFDRTVGLGAALFLAVAPFAVRDAHYVKQHVPVTLLVTLALAAMARLLVDPDARVRRGPWLAAGALAGLAMSTHYDAIFVVLSIAAVALTAGPGGAYALNRDRSQGPRSWRRTSVLLPAGRAGLKTCATAVPLRPIHVTSPAEAGHDGGLGRQRLEWLALAGLAAVVAFAVTSPFLIVEPGTALHDIVAIRQTIVDPAVGGGAFASLPSYMGMLWNDALGWPVAAAGAIGGLVAFAADWRRAVLLLGFALPFLLFISNTVAATRYLNPLLPVIAVLAALALTRAVRRTNPTSGFNTAKVRLPARRSAEGKADTTRGFETGSSHTLVTAAVLLVAAAPGLWASLTEDRFFRQTDTRSLAKAFIEREIPSSASVLVEPYSVPLGQSRDALVESLRENLGSETTASIKYQKQLEFAPDRSPAYRTMWLGDFSPEARAAHLDPDKIYISPGAIEGNGLAPLRERGLQYVVLKRGDGRDGPLRALLAALDRGGTRLAEFSPYRAEADAATRAGVPPFIHNSDARIDAALERPGPTISVYRLNP